MAFDGQLCWAFYFEVAGAARRSAEIDRRLAPHAEVRSCTCQPCQKLREINLALCGAAHG